MSRQGLAALEAGREDVLAVARSLSGDEWAMPSGCAGWRVQDVVAHMACVYRQIVEPGTLPPGVPGDVEASQEAGVAERRSWSPEQVLAEYDDLSGRGLEALAGLQEPPVADTVIPLENLGSHPLHLLANALAFDHFCHLRNDILRPNGPVERAAPPADDLRVGATVEWLMAGLPQMSAAMLAKVVDRPLALRLTGPGGGDWTIAPGPEGEPVEVRAGAAQGATATVTSSGTDFVLWGTHRRPWKGLATIEGDVDYATAVLDAIHVF